MVIIINPYAGGGTAIEKWKTIASTVIKQFESVRVSFLNKEKSMRNCIADLLKRGHREFIAGGGDGTLITAEKDKNRSNWSWF